ncbi:hypothetical protein [Anaerobacillus alkalidiazotrophicus]|uniref:hypothetical protein n=1 Tax=Anaerobacillus alkalidiazotrophicus TaxID=472963 RepID=UPI001471E5EC|nr:hypothetical protein [Anaerobacillus alkalidiazotrophicus]
MNGYIAQDVLNVIFTKLLPYLVPVLFLFMTALFSERLIDIIVNAVTAKTRKRR